MTSNQGQARVNPTNKKKQRSPADGGGKMPAQSIPPIVLITAGVAGMGALQYGVHWIFKPNKVRVRLCPPLLCPHPSLVAVASVGAHSPPAAARGRSWIRCSQTYLASPFV